MLTLERITESAKSLLRMLPEEKRDTAGISETVRLIATALTPESDGTVLALAQRHMDLFTTSPRGLAKYRQEAAKAGRQGVTETAAGLVRLNLQEHIVWHLMAVAKEEFGWDPATYVGEATTERHEAEESKWGPCPTCGGEMVEMAPLKAQCSNCGAWQV